MKLKISTILFIVIDILVLICFFVMYCPCSYIRNLYVTTAMQTMNHQWLAKIFYSDKTIERIRNNNFFISIDEDAHLDDVIINTVEKVKYKDEYEEELLTRDAGNDMYKVIDVKVGNANGYLVAIYHPEKVRLLRVRQFNSGGIGERVVDFCKRYKASVCINGGGFLNGLANGSDIPDGYVIDEGKVVWSPSNGSSGNIIGITKNGKLQLMNHTTGNEAVNAGVYYGIEFGPFLIVNGKSISIEGMPYGVANKCAIAQRKDGVMMFLVTEGETYIDGASLKDVVDLLEKYGAYNAANLDGGQSTSLVVDTKLVNSPNYLAKKQGGRYVVTAWGLVP